MYEYVWVQVESFPREKKTYTCSSWVQNFAPWFFAWTCSNTNTLASCLGGYPTLAYKLTGLSRHLVKIVLPKMSSRGVPNKMQKLFSYYLGDQIASGGLRPDHRASPPPRFSAMDGHLYMAMTSGRTKDKTNGDFLRWRYPNSWMGNGKSIYTNLYMDDDWGYPYDLENPQINPKQSSTPWL